MRRISAILLLLVFGSHAGIKISYTAWFWMNQDEIATRFCVNKEKVSMNCKGCCHLAQQLESMDHDKGEQLPSGLPTVPEDPFEYFLDSEQKLKFPISFSMKLTEKSIVPFFNPHIPGVPHPPPEV